MLWRWLSFLAEFPGLTITYKPGKDNIVADALSRNPLHQDSTAAKAAAYTPAIAAPAILATMAARATRSGRPIRLSRRVADPLADPLLYELDDAVCDDLAEKRQARNESTVANSSSSTRRPMQQIPQALRADDLLHADEDNASESLGLPEDAPETDDLLADSTSSSPQDQQRTIPVHQLPPDQQDYSVQTTAVPIDEDHADLPEDAQLFLPSTLNGLWGDVTIRDVGDIADLQQAGLGHTIHPGTKLWIEALRQCPTYSGVLSAAEERTTKHVLMAAKCQRQFVRSLQVCSTAFRFLRSDGTVYPWISSPVYL
ncbi:hypothetical protein Emed_007665 [Eimeria media]